ncbi:DUF397 domain-containing protein [Nocardiopsis sp. CNT312]|uniref:DUF397 domain-containing protein n=1 Tax=Nocardiopsis sp. CNT312 TaxID=1137268 RepID=UPI00056D2430|nr:DUF397 domain-containing protein [Nocardiopsis sp. CNT312]
MSAPDHGFEGRRTSSYGGTDADCVEAGWDRRAAAVRDSTRRGLGYLPFAADAWGRLTGTLKAPGPAARLPKLGPWPHTRAGPR